ncbi:MAG: hypothetical protein KAR36_11130, partial [Candidatus Latescibacteria bacterium]|nr:hypothetical protein [Candidatus Latescibacterota bacterium]
MPVFGEAEVRIGEIDQANAAVTNHHSPITGVTGGRAETNGGGMFWEKEIETMPIPRLRTLQGSRLRTTVD